MQRHRWCSAAGVGETGAWMEEGSLWYPTCVCTLPWKSASPCAGGRAWVGPWSCTTLLSSACCSRVPSPALSVGHWRSTESSVLPLTTISISRSSLEKISASAGVIFSCLSPFVVLSYNFCSPRDILPVLNQLLILMQRSHQLCCWCSWSCKVLCSVRHWAPLSCSGL